MSSNFSNSFYLIWVEVMLGSVFIKFSIYWICSSNFFINQIFYQAIYFLISFAPVKYCWSWKTHLISKFCLETSLVKNNFLNCELNAHFPFILSIFLLWWKIIFVLRLLFFFRLILEIGNWILLKLINICKPCNIFIEVKATTFTGKVQRRRMGK